MTESGPRSPFDPLGPLHARGSRGTLVGSLLLHGTVVGLLVWRGPRAVDLAVLTARDVIEVDYVAPPAPPPPEPEPQTPTPEPPSPSRASTPPPAATAVPSRVLTARPLGPDPNAPPSETVVQPSVQPTSENAVPNGPPPPLDGRALIAGLTNDVARAVQNGAVSLGEVPRTADHSGRVIVARDGRSAEERARDASQGFFQRQLAAQQHLEPAGLRNYYQHLARNLRQSWEPSGSRSGTIVVEIDQDAQARILEIRVSTSSRVAVLDDSAQRAMREAVATVPAIPIPGGRRARFRMEYRTGSGNLANQIFGNFQSGQQSGAGIFRDGISIEPERGWAQTRAARPGEATGEMRVTFMESTSLNLPVPGAGTPLTAPRTPPAS